MSSAQPAQNEDPLEALEAAETAAAAESHHEKPHFRLSWMMAMLVICLPLCVALELFHAPPAWVFLGAALAIVPLAGYMGQATEQLAKHLGATLGGLLNATFGNMTELIITIFAVRAGELDVVRASLIGSIIGNILLVLGMSAFLGGLKYRELKFSRDAAGTDIVQLFLAVIAILTPSLFVMSQHSMSVDKLAKSDAVEYMSLGSNEACRAAGALSPDRGP